jgi:branched-subunit amino acid permease
MTVKYFEHVRDETLLFIYLFIYFIIYLFIYLFISRFWSAFPKVLTVVTA